MTTNIPIHVLHIASGDLWAGAEMQLYTLANSQQSMPGITVSAVLLNDGELARRLREAGIGVSIIDEARHNGISILMQLRSLLREMRPDIVHTHRLKENILGSIAARSCNIPSVRTTHGSQEHQLPWHKLPQRGLQWLGRYCGRHLQQRIIAVSDVLGEELARQFGQDHVEVIENGIDCDSISGNKISDTYRHELDIGIIGRLTPVKRIDLFLQAAAISRQASDIELHFHVIGDGPLLSEMSALANSLEIDEHVSFHGHCDDVYDHMCSLDVLMMTSDHEGLPMTVLEAMVLKTPIICHAVGGLPVVLKQGACGILVERHDAEAYADALVELAADAAGRKTLADAAFERVYERYASDINAGKTVDVYREVLAHSGGV